MEEDLYKERLEKLNKIKELNINPYPCKFEVNNKTKDVIEKYKDLNAGEHIENVKVSMAGRVMSLREHGKSCFATVRDVCGQIQVYFKLDILGDKNWELLKKIDIGDFMGVSGDVFKTRTGELTIRAKEISLLSKSLMSLPEKWHGLKDVEIRYRQRYLDLISNPEVKDVFYTRSWAIKEVRNFLESKGFLEVETPMMHSIPGGATAKPFKTFHNALGMELYMRIAPELYLKRLIIGGFEKVYEMNRNFRNEGISIKHNPEFTMLELYQAYADYEEMMKLTEELLTHVVQRIFGKLKIIYQDKEIDFITPWKKLTMYDSIKEYAGLDVEKMRELDLKTFCKDKEINIEKLKEKGEIINEIFEKVVEHNLIQPTIIMDYPIEVSPLAKRKKGNDNLVERFELFIYGRETANAFSELNDPVEQRERFLSQVETKESNKIDEDFIKALEYGMPPTGGLGLGLDRFIMILTNSPSIRDVILFPQMRTKDETTI
ncbi:MAG: lysine--tRNA ligase [Candidatus Firestonebacteria bacterium]